MADETPKKPHGGGRKGAGRPKGSANVRTQEIANRVAKEGITPLEVMLEIMKEFRAEGNREAALDAAAKAAPYLHSKLSSVDMRATVKRDIEEYSDAELIALAVQAARGSSEGPEASPGPH